MGRGLAMAQMSSSYSRPIIKDITESKISHGQMSSITLAAPSPGDKESIYSIQRTLHSYSMHGTLYNVFSGQSI